MSTSSDHPVVVITGASSGIGRATAVAFAEKGARWFSQQGGRTSSSRRRRSAASAEPRRSRSKPT